MRARVQVAVYSLTSAVLVSPVVAQTTPADSDSVVYAAAGRAVAAGRSAEARALLRRAQQGLPLDRRLFFEFNVGDVFLYDGDAAAASRVFAAAERQASAAHADSLARYLHFSLALADAIAARGEASRAHLRKALVARDTLPTFWPSMIYALVGPTDSALAALARVEQDTAAGDQSQYVHAFRGLAHLTAGRCPNALAEVARAPRAQGPMVLAVRSRCAAAAGRRVEAVALRDSVLARPPADPLAETYIAARAVARRVR